MAFEIWKEIFIICHVEAALPRKISYPQWSPFKSHFCLTKSHSRRRCPHSTITVHFHRTTTTIYYRRTTTTILPPDPESRARSRRVGTFCRLPQLICGAVMYVFHFRQPSDRRPTWCVGRPFDCGHWGSSYRPAKNRSPSGCLACLRAVKAAESALAARWCNGMGVDRKWARDPQNGGYWVRLRCSDRSCIVAAFFL